MLNIVELEQRWLRYKIKSYIPHAVIVVSLIVIGSVIFLFSSEKEERKPQEQNITIVKTIPKIEKKVEKKEIVKEAVVVTKKEEIKEEPKKVQTLAKPIPQKTTEEPTQVKLMPSLDFMKKMQESMQPYYRENESRENQSNREIKESKKSLPQRETLQNQEEESAPVAAAPKPHIEKKTISHNKIEITRKNTQNDIYEIIERFKKNNNPALSLFVAKKYYELGEYKQSYNYALITNGINKNIESSWIIFAKSLVKLGEKEKAIKTLKKYIKQSHSNRAKILLDEIRSGKFQ